MSNSFVEAHHWAQGNTWYTTGINPITVGGFASLAENDLLIAFGRQSTGSDVTDLIANGWTVWNKTTTSGSAHFVAYKYAGATPDTTYEFTTSATADSNDGFVIVAAFRGVKVVDPLDIDFSLADHYLTAGSASTHTPADVLTRTIDAWVLSIILVDVVSGGPTTLSQIGHTIRAQNGNTNGPYGGISDKQEAVPGNQSPADWGLTVPASAIMYTLALRAADAIFVPIPNVQWGPSTGESYVLYEGDVIPESSCLMLHRGSHTGTSNSPTYTDSTMTLSANQAEGYRIYNFSDNSEGVIGSHNAGSGPLTLSTPLSGSPFGENDFDNGDKVDITIKLEAGDEIVYETTTNLGGTVSMNNVGSFTITGAQGIHTFSVKIRDATDKKVSSPFLVTSQVV